MRVGIIGLLHESNTFISERTTLRHFEQDTLFEAEGVRQRFVGSPHEIGGFFAGLEREQIDAVPLFAARAVPYGPIESESFSTIVSRILSQVEDAGHLDGILVAPHGATVCESVRDADGSWLHALRQHVGESMPIIGTLDAHANLSRLMVESTDALVAYRTNPHLDQRDRGIEAARLMARRLRNEISPVQHAEFPPLAINIERQATSEPHLTRLYAVADAQLREQRVLSNSILLGFPYADVEEMGSAALVVTNCDADLAERAAKTLATWMWNHRHQWEGHFVSIEQALTRAAELDGPVCLLDMGDNVGAGSPGDSTHLMHAIRNQRLSDCFVCLCDPKAVQEAIDAGIGNSVRLSVGGKTDQLHGAPYEAEFLVQSTHRGVFEETETRHGGLTRCDQGVSVVLRSCDELELTVLLTSLRMPPFSLKQLTSCDIQPNQHRVLIAKGVNAPVAAYGPVCQHLIRVNSPGCTTADMRTLEFHHRRRPMFPFEQR